MKTMNTSICSPISDDPEHRMRKLRSRRRTPRAPAIGMAVATLLAAPVHRASAKVSKAIQWRANATGLPRAAHQRAALPIIGILSSTAASCPGSSYVTAMSFRRSLLNFRVRLAADKDSRASEIQPKQKRNHRIQASIDSLRAEVILINAKQRGGCDP